jgi:hypothetical protein
MGADGRRRTVHRLCYGVEELYLCQFKDGGRHVYNDQHILVLMHEKSTELEYVAVQHFVQWGKDKKREYCAVRHGKPRIIEDIYPIGMGDFYGFELVEDRLFLHADGTVLSNTGKSFIAGWLMDFHLRVYPFSNALLTATNISQVTTVVWKYIDEAQRDVEKACPWMRGFFIKKAKMYYAKYYKDSWYVLPRTSSKQNAENLAGQHNFNLLVYADEASGIADENLGVLRGALTEERNRFVMSSQPTRPVGHFADAMTSLAKKEVPGGGIEGIYDTFILNSEESPIVSKKFIKEKLVEYGGHHSPEYQIKVLGRLPDNLSGYLIPKKWCEESQHYQINHTEEWGWVLTADVAEGVHRDSSVLTMGRVSGYGPERKVEVTECAEYLDANEKEFARIIAAKYRELPALTIAVDADGSGRTVILELEEMGIPVERIHWGLPCHSGADQKRYINQRAFAHLKLREAIFEERFKGPTNKKFVEQASKLPYKIDDRGRYAMKGKDQMRSEGIKSPDISDTCCFFYLTDYVPCSGVKDATGEEGDFLEMAKAAMES